MRPVYAIQYCLDTELLSDTAECTKCNGVMKLSNGGNYHNSLFYRCDNCHYMKHLLSGLLISSPKLVLNKYFLRIYKFLEQSFEKDVVRNLSISRSTYQKVKAKINGFLHMSISAPCQQNSEVTEWQFKLMRL